MARQLRAAGHLIYVTTELGLEGADDDGHLARATELGAVLASQNQSDFDPFHDAWQKLGRRHAGILVSRQLPISLRIQWLERADRMSAALLLRRRLPRRLAPYSPRPAEARVPKTDDLMLGAVQTLPTQSSPRSPYP